MSTTYYIVNEKIKENKDAEYKNLLSLINKIDDIVNIYCMGGKLSTGTLDDIQNSLSTWKWFVDDECSKYAFLHTTVNQYKFTQCSNENALYNTYVNIYTLEQALQFVENNKNYHIEDEYGNTKTVEDIRDIVSKRQSG